MKFIDHTVCYRPYHSRNVSKTLRTKTWEDVMRTKTVFALSASVAILSFASGARSAEPGVMALAPSEMKWSAQGGSALPGLEQTTLIADPGKPRPYTIRLDRKSTRLN